MSGKQVQALSALSAAAEWLEKNTGLSADCRQSLAAAVSSLSPRIDGHRPTCIGLSGAPGSGKSTLSRALVECLERSGTPACLLSLDDYYLGLEERERKAVRAHPLFLHRGVPGTHDLGRLLADYDSIRNGSIRAVKLPVFDKSNDDRAPESQWRAVKAVPGVIIIEGWCVGATPQQPAEMIEPVNDFEKQRDADGSWRRQVLQAWRQMHAALAGRMHQVWYIRVPDWDCVIDWRWQQEQELVQKRLLSRHEIEHFLNPFERIFRHMQATCEQWADLVIEADREHRIRVPDAERT